MKKKKTEPLVKIFEPENLKDGSFLSTKHKLIQRAFTTATPKAKLPDFKKAVPGPVPSSSKQSEQITPADSEPVLVPDDPVSAITTSPTVGGFAEPLAFSPSPVEYVPLADYDPDQFVSFEPLAEPECANFISDCFIHLTFGTEARLSCVRLTFLWSRTKMPTLFWTRL